MCTAISSISTASVHMCHGGWDDEAIQIFGTRHACFVAHSFLELPRSRNLFQLQPGWEANTGWATAEPLRPIASDARHQSSGDAAGIPEFTCQLDDWQLRDSGFPGTGRAWTGCVIGKGA